MDLKKDWRKVQEHLQQFKKDLSKIAQKGEKELKKLSHRSLLQVDSAALSLKKEHLLYLIGKEYATLRKPPILTDKLRELFQELNQLKKEHKLISKKIKSSGK